MSYGKKTLVVATLLVAFLGMVSFATIASRSVEVALFDFLAPLVESENLPPNLEDSAIAVNPFILPSNLAIVEVPGDGVVNYSGDHARLGRLLRSSISMTTGFYSETVGLYLPFPFLLPFIVHILVIRVARLAYCKYQSFMDVCVSFRTPDLWGLYSAFYACILVLTYQCTRMFWGSAAWDTSYLVSYRYGWVAFYIVVGLCVLMYFYCVIGTSGLYVRPKPRANEQACVRCGYSLDESGGVCQECGLEEGAWIPSKWRINHWYLGAMLVVTFFSPALVASVYSVFH